MLPAMWTRKPGYR